MSGIFQAVEPGQTAPPVFASAIFSASKVQYSTNLSEIAAPDAIFDLGSVTKILATTSIAMKLEERSLLDLGESVFTYLPYPGFDRFTVSDLLLHRSGLWEWWPLYAELGSAEEILTFISQKELRYPPSSQWHYSDLGFIVLGEVLKKISGASFPELFAELVGDPLGLVNTKYATPTNIEATIPSSFGDRAEFQMLESNLPYPINIRASQFGGWRTQILKGEVNDGNAFHLLGGVSSHSGLFSSLGDLVSFGQTLLGSDYFPNLIQFRTGGVDPIQGLGFRRFGQQFEAFGHTGFPGIAIVLDPELGRGFAFGTNRLLVETNPVPTNSYIEPMLELLKSTDI